MKGSKRSGPLRGQRVLRVFMYRGRRPVGSFLFWDQLSLDRAAVEKLHGEIPPERKVWETAHVSGETFGEPEYGSTGYGGTLTKAEILGPGGFALIVRRCGLRYCAKHDQLGCCTICEPASERRASAIASVRRTGQRLR